MAVNFAAALDTKAGDVEKPPVLPQGTYVWNVIKHTISQTKSGEWDIVEFQVKPVRADNVDEDELAAYGDLKSAINRVSFMFPTDPSKEADVARSMYQMKRFLLETLLIDGNEDSSMKELLAASTNCQFLANATWRQDGDNTYVDVKGWSPLD